MMGMPAHFLLHTATRLRATTATDTYNVSVPNWAGATELDMRAWLQQNARDEPRSDGRDPLQQTWLLITNEADILGTDRFRINGATYEVEGPPEPVYTPTGYHHTESTLRMVTG